MATIRMLALEEAKRYILTAAFLVVQTAQAHDDLAEMFIRRMQTIHQKGRDALQRYRTEHEQRKDALIGALRDVVVA